MNIIKRFIKFLIEFFKKLFERFFKKKKKEEIEDVVQYSLEPQKSKESSNQNLSSKWANRLLSYSKISDEQRLDDPNRHEKRHDLIEIFDSISELLSTLNSRKNNSIMSKCGASKQPFRFFSGTDNYEEAVGLIVKGYSKILPEIKKGCTNNVDILQQKYARIKSRNIDSVFGGCANVPRALMGLPKDLHNREVISRKVRTVTIFYSPTADASVSPDVFIKAGISMLSAINLIEISGVQVELILCFYAGYVRNIKPDVRETVVGAVKLKGYSDRINLLKMCFPMAHPSMLRRFGFKFLETVPNLKLSKFTVGYGSPCCTEELEYTIKRGFPMYKDSVSVTYQLIQDLNFDVNSIINYIKNRANVKE